MSSTRVSAALRRSRQARANGCCKYCLLSEDDAWFSHEPDHIIAEKHGGETTFENLAWACFDCNRYKGSDIASRDSLTGSLAPLFNPRLNHWGDHFEHIHGRVNGTTSIGRVTEKLLKLNLTERVEIRQMLVQIARYPGKGSRLHAPPGSSLHTLRPSPFALRPCAVRTKNTLVCPKHRLVAFVPSP